MFDLNYAERRQSRGSVDFKSPVQMCRHERNSVTSQPVDNREPECNFYKHGDENRHFSARRAVEFWVANGPERTHKTEELIIVMEEDLS